MLHPFFATHLSRKAGCEAPPWLRHQSEGRTLERRSQCLPQCKHPFSPPTATTSLAKAFAVAKFPQSRLVTAVPVRQNINVAAWPISRASLSERSGVSQSRVRVAKQPQYHDTKAQRRSACVMAQMRCQPTMVERIVKCDCSIKMRSPFVRNLRYRARKCQQGDDRP